MKNLTVYDLIHSLRDGRFHSGVALAEQYQVTRSAIWKVAKQLQALAVPLNHVRGKGYQIPGGIELLDEHKILSKLSSTAGQQVKSCLVLPEVSSTNEVLLKLPCKEGGAICAAEYQSKGRGRFGRSWHAPFASSLTFSLSWQLHKPIAEAAGMSLVVGIAIIRALETLGLTGLLIKWPNDIVFEDKKIAGVLVEISGDASGPCHLVIGIGINVRLPADFTCDKPFGDLFQLSQKLHSRNQLAAAIVNQLYAALPIFFDSGLQPFQDDWQVLDSLWQREICLRVGENEFVGTASGIDHAGNLQLLHKDTLRAFHSGEASVLWL